MLPEIHLGPLTLQSFGLMMGLGFVVAGLFTSRRLRELGRPADWAYELVLAALVGGIVGARLWWVAQNWDEASEDFVGSLFSGTGLVFYGGLFGGALAVLGWAAWRRQLGLWLFDLAAVPLASAYAVGRLGCQLAGDGDYGIPWDGPWAMSYPDGTVPTTDRVHPTPVYEFIVMMGVAWWLWRRRDAVRPGVLFGLYLVLSGVERFLIEMIRRNEDVVGAFSLAQLVALAMVAIGAAWLARLRVAGGGRVPVAARS